MQTINQSTGFRLRRLINLLVLMVALGGMVAPIHAQQGDKDAVGKVTKVNGLIFVRHGTSFKVAKPGLPIKLGSEISTAVFAQLEFELTDGTRVGMSERTVFLLDDYRYSSDAPGDSGAAFRIDSGALRIVPGDLSRARKENMKVITPLADVVGQGDATFWAGYKFFPDTSLHVALIDGDQVAVRARGGEAVVSNPGHGTILDTADDKPYKPSEWTPEKMNAIAEAVDIL
ncbi:MAG: hypothetical protein ACPG4N_07595 [Gammaproteobacteria bacterium]